jgi:hypothetical protein
MIESGTRLQTVIVTCIQDNRAHAVHDAQLATAAESGRYNALCGHVVAAAPMSEPDGEPCLLCEELRNLPIERPRPGILRRLL